MQLQIQNFVSAVTLSNEDSTKLKQHLKSEFKRTINWNKYQPKVTTENRIQFLDYLIDPSLQGVNILFVLLFENNANRTRHKEYLKIRD